MIMMDHTNKLPLSGLLGRICECVCVSYFGCVIHLNTRECMHTL